MDQFATILIAIRRITRAIDLHSRAMIKQSGLTVPQLLVLQAVRRNGAASITTIAQEVRLSPATITSMIERLQRAQLVTRTRSETDKRVVLIALTEAGNAKLDAAPEPMQEHFMREFEKLELWEQLQLSAALERVAFMMDAEALDASPILEVGELKPDPDSEPL